MISTQLYAKSECPARKQERTRSHCFFCQILFNVIAIVIILLLVLFIYRDIYKHEHEHSPIEEKMKECEMIFKCHDRHEPVCGSDNLNYHSKCHLHVTDCQFPEMGLTMANEGHCDAHLSVTLVGGNSPREGNVYARNHETGIFGPVCDDAWSLSGANVVCTQLGYVGALRFSQESYFGPVTPRFSFDNVKCYGSENFLDECRHIDYSDCNGYEAAGVICDDGNGMPNVPTTSSTYFNFNFTNSGNYTTIANYSTVFANATTTLRPNATTTTTVRNNVTTTTLGYNATTTTFRNNVTTTTLGYNATTVAPNITSLNPNSSTTVKPVAG